MRAETKDEDLFELRENEKRVPNSPLFTNFVGAIGWPDEGNHDHYALSWACVGGITEEGRLILIHEQSSSPSAFADTLIRLKDNFLLSRYFVCLDTTNIRRMKALRLTPELTFYPGRKILTGDWKFYPATSETFRRYDLTAAIIEKPVDPEVGLYELKRLTSSGVVMIRPNCSRITWLIRQPAPFKSILTHPLLSAVTCLLEEHRPKPMSGRLGREQSSPYQI